MVENKTMRVASIDCGTNTVVLFVAEISDNQPHSLNKVEDLVEYTRLGQGLSETGFLQKEAMSRTLFALKQFQTKAKELQADPIFFFATQAVRQAQNGQDFIQQAKNQGMDLRILQGEEEATYAWKAVLAAMPLPQTAWRTVVDSGGGSTQLLVGQGNNLHELKSIPLGMVFLTECFLRKDPPSTKEKIQLEEEIQKQIVMLPKIQGELIGISGTLFAIESLLCASSSHPAPFHPEEFHGKVLHKNQLDDIAQKLGNLSIAERRKLIGMEINRADVLYAGAMIWATLMKENQIESMILCNRNVRFGVLADWALSKQK